MSWKKFIACALIGNFIAAGAIVEVGFALHAIKTPWIGVIPPAIYVLIFLASINVMLKTKFGFGRAWQGALIRRPTCWGAVATGFVACTVIRLITL